MTNSTSFLPRDSGDITIAYDVIQSYPSSYLAQVTIENRNPLGRLDHWQLSWEWERHEFIHSMKGAYPAVIDASDCIFGRQGQFYTDSLDFSKALSCKRKPTIVDLPPWRFNDTDLGGIPHCCRNGTILSPEMDLEKVVSSFQLQVSKIPRDLNRSILFPPGQLEHLWHAQAGLPVRPAHPRQPLGVPRPERPLLQQPGARELAGGLQHLPPQGVPRTYHCLYGPAPDCLGSCALRPVVVLLQGESAFIPS